MEYDFNRFIDRQNTWSIKYNMAAYGKPADALPLWVADMDFQSPPGVIEALCSQSRHGIYGYSNTDKSYFDVLQKWFARRFSWNIEEDWLVKTHGVVNAIYTAVNAFTEPGQNVMIQQPVYYPFAASVQRTGRRLIVNQLHYENNRYTLDLADFEKKITQHNVKLFILCNPHNPVGRVWTRKELTGMAEICLRHRVLVVADEIHQDFIFPGHQHLVFSELIPDCRDITITCTAPSKTFNIAGLQVSNIFISNPALRKKFSNEYSRSGLAHINVMGIVACKAAYKEGEEWLEHLLIYLADNLALLRQFFTNTQP
ncbi:MAG: PatB family C-S lyase, partial [Peptococcaceae bacterium]|nr:PatB family C-S lyase [Peptococcaceae bacterium]